LAKQSLSAKLQQVKKTTPFDEELFPYNGAKINLGSEDKVELFGEGNVQNFTEAVQEARIPLNQPEPENFPPLVTSHPPTEQGNDMNVFNLF
jgi:hypothetical protein